MINTNVFFDVTDFQVQGRKSHRLVAGGSSSVSNSHGDGARKKRKEVGGEERTLGQQHREAGDTRGDHGGTGILWFSCLVVLYLCTFFANRFVLCEMYLLID